MLLVIISGGIDLSVGSVVALVSVVTMQVYQQFYTAESVAWASTVAVTAGILVGGLCGLVNGLVVTRLRLPPEGIIVWQFGRTGQSWRGVTQIMDRAQRPCR